MDNFVTISTILANLVTIWGIPFAFYVYLKKSEKIKIILDETLTLLTPKKKFEKTIIKLIKDPEKIHKLEIFIKSKKQKINNIIVNVLEKRNELQNINTKLLIKRGIVIMLYELLDDYNNFYLTHTISFSETVENYIKYIHNCRNYDYSGKGTIFDIFIKYDKINLNTKVRLSKDNEERLKKRIRENFGIVQLEYKDIEDVDNTVKYQVMNDFIMQLSQKNEFWDGDNFIYKEKLPFIFMSGLWDMGPA